MARIVRISASQNILANGGKMQFPMDFLPARHRIESMHLAASIVTDVPLAGVTSEQQTALVDGLACERRLQSSGLGESCGDWQVNGKDATRPAALAQGNGQNVELFWPLTFRDPRGIEPTDTCPATDFYRGTSLEVMLRKPSDLVASWVISSGSVELVAYISELPADVVPASFVKGYVEVIGKEVRIPKGALVDLYLVKNDGSTITDAEMGNVQLSQDGQVNLVEKVRTKHLARSFNYFVAKGAQQQGATDGVEGEALPNDGALPFVPVYHPVAPFKATKLPVARDNFILTFDGTLAANVARAFYRIIEPQDEVQTLKAAAKLGIAVDASTTIEGKTASKSGVPKASPFKRVAGLIARRFRRAA